MLFVGWLFLFVYYLVGVVLRTRLDILFINCLCSSIAYVLVYLCICSAQNWKWGSYHLFFFCSFHKCIHTSLNAILFCFVCFVYISLLLIRALRTHTHIHIFIRSFSHRFHLIFLPLPLPSFVVCSCRWNYCAHLKFICFHYYYLCGFSVKINLRNANFSSINK